MYPSTVAPDPILNDSIIRPIRSVIVISITSTTQRKEFQILPMGTEGLEPTTTRFLIGEALSSPEETGPMLPATSPIMSRALYH